MLRIPGYQLAGFARPKNLEVVNRVSWLALGRRGIELGLDIYEADEEVRNAQRQ